MNRRPAGATGVAADPLFWLALAVIPLATLLLAVLPGVVLRPQAPPLVPFAMAVLAYPLLEETVFRAGLQAWLLRRWPQRLAGLSAANLLTAAVFAAMHLWFHPAGWALATALPALLFGYFYERHGRLRTPILLHGACNAFYFTLLG